MEYQALYRKYRPSRFDEVVGQRHVTETLKHEIVEGTTAHAYLFAGPRGTGKTTTARLLAKSLNCASPGPDGEPDNTCLSCESIASSSSLDVIELDAASHNKVEDIREIRANVSTVAVSGGSRRVYILDEAHMLSRAAGNALLKTLEEPPEHVVFVLATTEPYKLLDTIRSRSQRFDFLPVASETLIAHLEDIAARESFAVDAAALSLIASHAGGSVRDAMSLLEQVAALGQGTVQLDAVARALGLADPEAFSQLADAVRDGDAPAALTLVAGLSARGADLRRFLSDALGYFRGIFLAHYSPNLTEVVDESSDVIAQWQQQAKQLSPGETLRVIDELGEALLELRQGREERLVIELALLKITRPETAEDVAALRARLDRLEQEVKRLRAQGVSAAPTTASEPAPTTATPAPVSPDAPFTASTEPAESVAEPETPDPTPESQPTPEATREPEPTPSASAEIDFGAFTAAWPMIVAGVRDVAGPRRHALIKEAVPTAVEGGVVVLEVPSHLPFHLEQLRNDESMAGTLSQLAADHLGSPVGVEFVGADGSSGVSTADEPDEVDVLDNLVAAGPDSDTEIDPAELVVDLLGGEIVSD